MPQLIGLIVVLVLYYFLIKWLFTAVVPDFLMISILLGIAVIPLVYARAVFRYFPARGVLGYGALFFVGVLLFLIYFDVGFVAVDAVNSVVHAQFGRALAELFGAVATQLPGNRELVYWGANQFNTTARGSLVGLVLLSALIKGLGLVPLLLISRGLKNEVPGTGQPARLQYFFSQAYTDLESVVSKCTKDMSKVVSGAFLGISAATVGPQAIIIWPLSITAWGALIPVSCAAVLVLVMLIIIHGVSALLVATLNLYLAMVLYVLERVIMLVRSGYAKCPHAGCHAPVPLPNFSCPQCGASHSRLLPGRYGVFYRRCKCDRAMLPTLYLLGKASLPSQCPSCLNPLRKELFLGSLHLPIYGGPSAGKTMFMMGATWQLLESQLPDVKTALIKETDQQNYRNTWKPHFESGLVYAKTTRSLPDAFLLALTRRGGFPLSLYMYDPDGIALAQDEALRGHRFLRYLDGLALIIDPLSLPSMAERFQEEGGAGLPVATSPIDPTEVVNHIVTALEHQKILAPGQAFKRRIAVILSKADIPFVQKELGLALRADPPGQRWQDLGHADSDKIRGWLARHEKHLLQLLETRFSNLRFFAVSSLGHAPAPGTGFSPRQILAPLCWLLATRRTLSHPVAARVATGLAELLAMAAVLGLLVATPALGLRVLHTKWRTLDAGARAERESLMRQATPPPLAASPVKPPTAVAPTCTPMVRADELGLSVLPTGELLAAELCKLGSTDVARLWGKPIATVESRLVGWKPVDQEDPRRFLAEVEGSLRGGRSRNPTALVRFGFLDGRLFRLHIHLTHGERKLAQQLQASMGRPADLSGKNEEGVPYTLWRHEGQVVELLNPQRGQDIMVAQATDRAEVARRLVDVIAGKKLVLAALSAFRARPADMTKTVELNQKALTMVPTYADAAVNLCGAYYDLGNLVEAVRTCQQAEAITIVASVRGEAKYYRGLMATQQQQKDEATPLLTQADAELPKSSRLRPGLKLRLQGLSGDHDVAVTRAALFDHLCYAARSVPQRSAAIPKEYGFATLDELQKQATELTLDTTAIDTEVQGQCSPR